MNVHGLVSLAGGLCIAIEVIMAGGAAAQSALTGAQSGACRLKPGATAEVASIIDGETVILKTGKIVRLIGLKAPVVPLSAKGAWSRRMVDAARKGLSALVLGKNVELRFGGTRKDRRGKLLAHLFIADPPPVRWVQGEMLERGLGRAYSFRDNKACMPELLGLEEQARKARRGIWAAARTPIETADAVRRLGRLVNTFQLVEGRVNKVTALSRRTYLNFGADWRRDFTVSIVRKDRASFAARGIDLGALEGRRIRVRGWLRWINGPAIEASHAEQIELLDR